MKENKIKFVKGNLIVWETTLLRTYIILTYNFMFNVRRMKKFIIRNHFGGNGDGGVVKKDKIHDV